MGLDMYAYVTDDLDDERDVDFTVSEKTELHRWWGHRPLHVWMRELYLCKGGIDSMFNCNNLALAPEELDQLETDLLAWSKPGTNGFAFFGECDEGDIEDDLDFIRKAREAMAAGHSVYYTSWW